MQARASSSPARSCSARPPSLPPAFFAEDFLPFSPYFHFLRRTLLPFFSPFCCILQKLFSTFSFFVALLQNSFCLLPFYCIFVEYILYICLFTAMYFFAFFLPAYLVCLPVGKFYLTVLYSTSLILSFYFSFHFVSFLSTSFCSPSPLCHCFFVILFGLTFKFPSSTQFSF